MPSRPANGDSAQPLIRIGSRKWKRLVGAEDRQLTKIRNQIKDLLHKQSTRLMKILHERRVGTVVVGDLTGIRNGLDYGSEANQRLHQWAYSEFARMIEYKARLHGMTAQRVGEAYTTQTCPQCGNRHKPPGRTYSCDCFMRLRLCGAQRCRRRSQYPERSISGRTNRQVLLSE